MAIDLRGLRVFIASPGGLEGERQQFRSAVVEFNENDGHERGVTFIPIGWEITPGGIGRPQEKINAEVRKCDFLVLVLWDRWGTAPSVSGPYTSGTEEEYEVARAAVEDTDLPMRDILVLFKGVEAKQLSDPGKQLARVLEFKKTLEREKSLLFQTFDTNDEFQRHLRRQLLVWARESGDDSPAPGSSPPPSSGNRGGTDKPDEPEATASQGGLVDLADAYAKEGRLVEAESLYARAVVGGRDLNALTKYIRFLRRTGRFDQALLLSAQLRHLSHEDGDWRGTVEAFSNEAIIERKLGNLSQSIEHLRAAIDIAERAGNDGLKDLAFLHDNLGLTLRKLGDLDLALQEHLRAVQVRQDTDDPRGLANALNHTGALLRQFGRAKEATDMHKKSLKIFTDLDYPRGRTQALANLAEDLQSAGQFSEAEALLKESLSINEMLQSPDGIGMNLWQLGRLALQVGDVDGAREYAERAITADDFSGRPEGIAGAYHLLGQVEIAQGRYDQAIDALDISSETYARGNHRLGEAWTKLDLARALFALGERDAAMESFDSARASAGGLQHSEFSNELEAFAQRLASSGPPPD